MRLVVPGLLLGVSLMLGAAIAYDAVAPLDPVAVESPYRPAQHPSTARPLGYAPPPAEAFADIDTRPLFSATRQPLADKAQTAFAGTSDLTLVGVIMGGQRAVALLRNRNTSATMSAAVGDLVEGWRVARIDATTVTLRADDRQFVVPLDGPANRPPSAPLKDSAPEPASPPVQAPPAAAPAAQAAVVNTPAKPVLPAHPPGGTIAPEAVRGAPVDPTTGQPTL